MVLRQGIREVLAQLAALQQGKKPQERLFQPASQISRSGRACRGRFTVSLDSAGDRLAFAY